MYGNIEATIRQVGAAFKTDSTAKLNLNEHQFTMWLRVQALTAVTTYLVGEDLGLSLQDVAKAADGVAHWYVTGDTSHLEEDSE